MDVQEIAAEELDDWAAFVAGSSAATGLHAPGWRAVLSEAFAVEPIFLRARAGAGRLTGVLPLFRSRSLLFGDFISSLEDGHCGADIDAARMLGRGALDVLAQKNCGCLIYKTNFASGVSDAQGQRVDTVKTVVPTDQSSEKLFAALDSNTRRKVRKAGREGYTVRDANDRLGAFYSIYSTNLHRLGTPVFGPEVYQAMQRHLGQHLTFYALERGDQLVGGMVCLKASQEWTSLYVAVEDEAQKQYGGYLLYWTAIEAAARAGAVRLNLGRSIVGSGAHRFKHHWAGEDVVTTHWIFGPEAGRAAKRLGSATTHVGLKNQIWKRLPGPVANAAGSYLRRSLPFV